MDKVKKIAEKIFKRSKLENKRNGILNTFLKSNDMEFKEIKEYNNDNIKYINWKVTAKKNKLHSNIFEGNKKLNIVNIYLNDGNTEYGNKKILASKIISSLIFSSLSKNFAKTKTILFNKNIEKIYDIKDYNYTYKVIEDIINSNNLNKEVDYQELLNYIMKTKEKTIFFIISDFFEFPLNLNLRTNKHEIYFIIARNKDEETLDNFHNNNSIEIQNPINNDKLNINITKKLKKLFKKEIIRNDDLLIEYFRDNNIEYMKVYEENEIN
jgi:hypothetical protein